MKPNKKNLILCPSCGKEKQQFETEKEALDFIKWNGEDIIDDISKLRVYYCESCACFHITSKPFTKKYNNITDKLILAYQNDLTTQGKSEDKSKRKIDRNIWTKNKINQKVMEIYNRVLREASNLEKKNVRKIMNDYFETPKIIIDMVYGKIKDERMKIHETSC